MPWDGNGNFVPPTLYFPEVNGTIVDANRYNPTILDVASGLENCLTLDGQTVPTANIPMGTYVFTGLGAGTASTHSARYGQVLNNETASIASAATVNLATATATDITVTGTTTITSFGTGLAAGPRKWLTFTGALTLTHSSTLICPGSANLALAAGQMISVRSEGANVWRVDDMELGLVTMPNGTVGSPGLAFASDLDNGFYRIGANNWALSVAGIKIVELGNATYTLLAGGSGKTHITSGNGATDLMLLTGGVAGLSLTSQASSGTSGPITLAPADNAGTGADVTITGGLMSSAGGTRGGHLNLFGGRNSAAASSDPGGDVNIAPGSYVTSTSLGGKTNFQKVDTAGAKTSVWRVRGENGLPEGIASVSTPTITSGAGTTGTIAGWGKSFVVTYGGASISATLAIDLSALAIPSGTVIATVCYEGASALTWRLTGASNTGITVVFSSAPVAGEKCHIIIDSVSAA